MYIEHIECFQSFAPSASKMPVSARAHEATDATISARQCHSGSDCPRVRRVPGERCRCVRRMVDTVLYSPCCVYSQCTCLIYRLPRYVRDAVLRAAAVALKRLSLSPTFNVTPQMLSLVENLADRNAPPSSVSLLEIYLT